MYVLWQLPLFSFSHNVTQYFHLHQFFKQNCTKKNLKFTQVYSFFVVNKQERLIKREKKAFLNRFTHLILLFFSTPFISCLKVCFFPIFFVGNQITTCFRVPFSKKSVLFRKEISWLKEIFSLSLLVCVCEWCVFKQPKTYICCVPCFW